MRPSYLYNGNSYVRKMVSWWSPLNKRSYPNIHMVYFGIISYFHYRDVTWASWRLKSQEIECHYNDVIMSTMASQITSLTIVCSTVYSAGDQRKHQSTASLAFVWGIHRWPVNSPHKRPVTRKIFPFDDVIMFFNSLFRFAARTHQNLRITGLFVRAIIIRS